MTPSSSDIARGTPLRATDFHVLLVLSERDLYGYAIMRAVEEDSAGAVVPEVGSLYRILARLIRDDMVEEAEAPAEASDSTKGLPRKYYRITNRGREVLRSEVERLSRAVQLAHARRVLSPSEG